MASSIVNVVLPTITQFFDVHISTAQWIPMVYLLAISGLAGFIIASGLCAFSPSIFWLIGFRALQGLAAGMMMAVPFAIITHSFPPTERGKAMGIYAISIAAGLAIGPSLGGFITSLLGWRFVFLINIPIGMAGLIWAYHIIPESKGETGTIDLPGVITAAISLFSFILFVNRFQSTGWCYATGGMLLTAILASVMFLWIERHVVHPLLNLNIFKNTTFSFANISTLLNFLSQYVLVFLTPFYLQRILHHAYMAGAILTGTASITSLIRKKTRIPETSG
jgi:MFS family permease